ncbi:MAG: 2-oxoacid:ferredoxin oxidoreductase subunit beta [Thermoprotei archaeon]|nr:MAG: 2-oxoacid:ferredoxin oxidoreductase subunit beta [Thermoprotei archaeon]
MIHELDDLLRVERLPHVWCPGCGIGIALSAFLRAVKTLTRRGKVDPQKIVFISGIGCTGRAAGYVKLDAAHTPHGRALAYAVGVKLAKPELKVVVFTGDGDLVGIGGNHFLHAARRNFDLLVIMVNNMIYALTGGQLAPTTPQGVYTTTTPYGNPEPPLDSVKIAAVAGATYIARWPITLPLMLQKSIERALVKKGFRFIEVISTCPEIFGRHIGYRDPVELLKYLRKIVKIRKNISPLEAEYDWFKVIDCGVFLDVEKPGYIELYSKFFKIKEG